MIVRPADGRLFLITQPDHARLSGRIMEHCASLQTHARRQTILRAIGAHDDGWLEEDAAPRILHGTGAVADFVGAPIEVRQGVWARGISRMDDAWAAALIAQHAMTIYDRFRGEPGWREFFREMEGERDVRVRASGLTLDQLLTDYPFVRLGDLISLTFCTRATFEPYAGWAVAPSGESVRVTPDTFAGAAIPIEIPARSIPDRRYTTDAELRAAFQDAEVVQLRSVCA